MVQVNKFMFGIVITVLHTSKQDPVTNRSHLEEVQEQHENDWTKGISLKRVSLKKTAYQTKKGKSGTKIDNSGHNIEFTSLQRQLEI